MTKAERILEFIHKIAAKHGITYEQAEQLAMTREFIRYIEQEQEVYVLPRRCTNDIKSNCS